MRTKEEILEDIEDAEIDLSFLHDDVAWLQDKLYELYEELDDLNFEEEDDEDE